MSDTKQELQLANALLKEHIVNQQSTIDRLTEQRDRLLEMLKKMMAWIHPKHISTDGEYLGDVREMKALIAKIEAGK